MSSPSLNHTEFALIVDQVALSPEAQTQATSETSPLLTARAILAVSVIGAGFWFLLWKAALLLLQR